MNAFSLRREFAKRANPAKATLLSGFFKTGKGEYAEGDRFYGVTVPETRAIVKRYSALPFADIKRLLEVGWHEERLCALLLLVERFKRGSSAERKIIKNYRDPVSVILCKKFCIAKLYFFVIDNSLNSHTRNRFEIFYVEKYESFLFRFFNHWAIERMC